MVSLPPSLTGAFSLASSRLIASVVAFGTTTLIARGLTTAEVGVYSMVIGSCAYLTILSECGLRSVAMTEGSRIGSITAVLKPYILARLGIALALTPIAFLVAAFGYAEYLPIAAPILLCSLLIPFHVDWVLLVQRRYNAAGWATASRWLFNFVLVAALHFTVGLSLVNVAALFTTSWALAILLSWWMIRGERSQESTALPQVSKRRLLNLGWPVLGASLLTQAMLNADLLWIGASFGKSDAGIYYLATTVITAGLILANAMNQIALPKYGALTDDPQLFASKLSKDLAIITGLSVVLVLGTIFVLPHFIPLVFGSKYQASADLIAHMAPYLVAYHVHSLYSACTIPLGIQRKVLVGLSSLVLVIPAALYLAAKSSSLSGFAYAKCFLFVYAIAVYVWATPGEIRKPLMPYLALPVALIAVLTVALAETL